MAVYLIPTVLAEGALETIPSYIREAVEKCTVFFVENERTARRFLKSIWREIVIDNYQWYTIHKAELEVLNAFSQHIKNGDTIGIISEAGCPGVADPGQLLVAKAQELNVTIKPLVGPSSLLLALMASGLNGQSFRFHGYLPIDGAERRKAIMQLEEESIRKEITQLFIETPYRNDAVIKEMIQTCKPTTRLCIAVDITAATEMIVTKTIREWKEMIPTLHKRPVVFLLGR
jgi:16S rRNA (cytidine1402-2'-O)-methyltransferase